MKLAQQKMVKRWRLWTRWVRGLLGTSQFIQQQKERVTNCHYSRTRSCSGSQKVSDRKAVCVIAETAKSLGQNIGELALYRHSPSPLIS